MIRILAVVAAIFAAIAGCSGNSTPEDTAAKFMERVMNSDMDGAREYLARDQWDELEDFCEGKMILSYSIGAVWISEDGNSATVEWNTSIEDENSPDTNEGNEFLLEFSQDTGWLISDMEHEGY